MPPKLYGSDFRRRFPQLLTEAGREHPRRLENRVIARLRPPDMAFIGGLPEAVREDVLSGRRPRATPCAPNERVWMRQGSREDVDALLSFIAESSTDVIARFRSLASAEGPP
jgi:hypothetical protein